MSEIFISYSRIDSEPALALASRLRAAGLDVWIDLHGIEAATSWSKEIVQAIDNCKIFLLLLSSHSVESPNVVREVSLAFESDRTILPVDIESVALPPTMRYQLAGIQRVAYREYESILRAMQRYGIGVGALPKAVAGPDSGGGTMGRRPAVDPRKSLMVLPFEDLSPDHDNAWFADGLMSELIASLSNVKTLRLIDRRTSMDYKDFIGKTSEIARDLSVRYFLEGSVRKYSDEIKISMTLLDFDDQKQLWSDSLRGKFADIFDIQEEVARRVLEGLRLSLSPDEELHVFQRDTESPEAYELSLKANDFFLRQTQEGFRYAADLWAKAIAADRKYVYAYKSRANALAALYADYERKTEYLEEAEALAREALRLDTACIDVYQPLSHIYRLQDRMQEAEDMAKLFVRRKPNDYVSHFALGYFYMQTDRPTEAIPAFEAAVRLRPEELTSLINLVIVSDSAGNDAKAVEWALFAMQHIERHLRLHPDDEGMLVQYALLLSLAGKAEETRALIPRLQCATDGSTLYNAACILVRVGEHLAGIRLFRQSIAAGFTNLRLLRDWLDDDMVSHVPHEELEEAQRMIDALCES